MQEGRQYPVMNDGAHRIRRTMQEQGVSRVEYQSLVELGGTASSNVARKWHLGRVSFRKKIKP